LYSETKSRLLLHGRVKFISNCILKLNHDCYYMEELNLSQIVF